MQKHNTKKKVVSGQTRPGQPIEVASAYLFLASGDASYLTGQFIHVNGGEIING